MELIGRIAHRFGRVEPQRRVRAMLLGMLAGLPKVNCWTIAEHAGETSPDGMQHLLSRARWDADGVRDYVIEHLGDQGAVLVVDETGDMKKGSRTVGVQRQYTGTAGRIENAQVAVYLTYATADAHAFLDRALYLPRSWVQDEQRCIVAGIPAGTSFATKPALAQAMIVRALDAGVPACWVAGDEVYGQDPQLRAELEARGVGYVLGVASTHRVRTHAGMLPAVEVAKRLPPSVWQTHSCGPGAKGHRYYAWALVDLDEQTTGRRLLIRHNRRTGELAFYRAWSPTPVRLPAFVTVAGRRWRIEENFRAGKGLAALDEHQVRSWTSWHRWTILAMLAHAFLAVTAAAERNRGDAGDGGLISLTCNEIRHLFTALLRQANHALDHLLHWSRWRRQHQTRARASHYRRQAARP
jgi:SRSO17 transposase